jgi:transposase
VDNGTRWIGIDLHRRRSQLAVIDEHGELELSRRIVNDRETFLELLGDPERTHVALEATYGWEWLAELLEEAGYDLHLAHPLRTRAIAAARVKTRRDRREDARAPAARRVSARGVRRATRAARFA